ncbi:hypothetical protein [Flavobacterium solisilvae]|uniref:Uncharacterized protein n=1 Tax=Flavobacterium solisilvae TaxID=1852019 RepID=A0ABX1QT30_9FLAO|nr:hypothetical protein [Flavobacterium solisilvae]NMH23994.1 hypothetical protein [Flavobacterium solisilvae]
MEIIQQETETWSPAFNNTANGTYTFTPAAGSHTRDRRRHADAIRMVFDKNLFR